MWNDLGTRQFTELYRGIVERRREMLADYTHAMTLASRGEGKTVQTYVDALRNGSKDEGPPPAPPERGDIKMPENATLKSAGLERF